MKILQISSTFFPILGGQEKIVYEISKELTKKGHKITILTTDLFCEEKNLPNEEIKERIKILRFKNDFYLGGYGYSKKAIDWLKENWKNYDIAHSHGYNRYLSEFSVKYLYNKIPVIFTPHGFIHTKKNYIFKKVHDITLGKFIKKATYCTALTKLDFKEYQKLGVKKEKIIEIPNGVQVKEFSKIDKREIKKIQKKFGKEFILYVGRIHKSKGLQYVLEAIKDLKVKLIIVGKDGGYKDELEKQIDKLKIKDKIIFAGSLNEKKLIDTIHTSKALILFSEWEGFGIVVIEAMASGKPVIVSDRGSLPLLVEDMKTGIVVPFKNIEILKKQIKFILKNKKEREKMGKEGKKFSKNYSWEKIINKIEQVYKMAIKCNLQKT